MEIKETIGIDVSKLTLDAHIHSSGDRDRFENNTNGFKKLVAWAYKRSLFPKENVLFIFEHTGLYSRGLSLFFGERKLPCHIAAGLEIKRSLGIARGKNDQVDARRIALYAYRLREEIQPSKVADVQIRKLRTMFSLRSKLIKQRAGYKTTLKEQKGILSGKDYNIIFEIQNNMVDTLTGEIHKLEQMMMEIIKGDKGLSDLFKLVTSVKGVGPMTAMLVIIYTNRFTKFHTWRKFASYCGVAPFPHQSGTSIKGRSKVSHFANKELKAILNMCAASAIQYNPEMKRYYERRTEEGKNKMSTLNVIRNKLIARVFAVVNRGTPYINVYRQAS
ncbi:IS110 family transposase [Flagellimonas algicola]|uniref:IS110 family transposase n=1 Tax=Flagellimonas algicola TaxID=2583815 RepID=A0ABY2WR33_9FLAO|nr:IS110 family transposase [Allomuricauda algicola]TMU57448.1 IS110 family transposase [Allomuricauda algicola]